MTAHRYGRLAARWLAGPRIRAVSSQEAGRALRRQWDGGAVREHRDALLAEVVAAARHTAYYPRAFGDAALAELTHAHDLPRLAVLPRNTLRANAAHLVNTAIPAQDVDVTFTSGTNGAASHVVRPRASLHRRAICERRWYHELGLPWIFELTCATPWAGQGRDNTTVRDPRVGYREEGFDAVLDRLDSGRSVGELLLVSPDMLPTVAKRVTNWGDITAVASSFEVLRPEHGRDWPSEAPPLVEMYCAAEICVPLAFSFPGCRGMHVNADHLYVEIVDDDGTPQDYHRAGHLVVTDLVNTAMPLLRYLIGDAGILRPPSACGCGRMLPLVEVLGRLPDTNHAIGGVPAGQLMDAVSAVTEHGFVLEQRDETTTVVHLDPHDQAERAVKAVRSELPELAVHTQLLVGPLAHLAHPGGRLLAVAPRHPYRADSTASMPPRIHALHELPESAVAGARSPRSIARRLLRDRYQATATTTDIPILDASRSMYPLFDTATRVTVAWGKPDPATAVGTIALVELPQDILAAHRVADWRIRDGTPEILQCADNYDRHNPFSAFWVPLDSVLGTVTAATTTYRAGPTIVSLTGRFTRWTGRIVAAADRWLVSSQRRRRPLPVVLAAAIAQRLIFRATNVLLRLRGKVSHRLRK
ncbi:hypothetical protein ACFYV7_35770 [Nocardia suismassiliense]|uniref:Coenzyme F390 synthetase n=1 Tax=Nocardia suismassiliense TaxID=2077092 RepID=A0ABW6R556_9NOCA